MQPELREATDRVRRPGHHAARRRRHQLPQRHRPGQERRVVRRQGRPHRRRPAASRRPADGDHRPDRGPGDHLPAQRRGRGRRPARRPAGRPRRPRHGAGDRQRGPLRLRQPAPAGRLDAAGAPRGVRALQRPAQVQVRTVLQHAWAEFEHAIRYKGTIPEEHVPDLDRRFTLAAGLLELADREFTPIRDRLQATVPEQHPEADHSDPRISAQDLATFLAGQYADAGLVAHRPLRLDLRAAARARHHLPRRARRAADLGGHRGDQRADGLPLPARRGPPARRRAARRSSGSGYVALHGNDHRVGLLRTRLDRLSTPPDTQPG